MKYETIKARVTQDVCAAIERTHTYGSIDGGVTMAACLFDAIAERRPVGQSVAALQAECSRIVANWDIRAVGKLRDLFPASFPRSLRAGPLVCEYDEAGNWVVLPAGR